MKFSVDRDIIQGLLTKAAGTVSSKDIQPILKNFLIKAEGSRLSVMSTDNSLGALAELEPVQIDVEGMICVPAKKLTDMAATAPSGMMRFELDGRLMSIFSAYAEKDANNVPLEKPKFKNKWELHCEDGALYPEFPNFDQSKATTCVREPFVQGVHRVSFAAADDELKANLMAVYINNGHIYAADGHCAAKLKFESDLKDVMIPAPAVKMLVSVLRGSQAPDIHIFKTKFHLLFKVGNDIYHSRLLEGKFPDIEKRVFAVADSYEGTLKLKRDELRKAIKRARITSSEETHQLMVQVVDGTCTIKTQNTAEDKYEETFDFTDWDGENFEHGINWEYLESVANALSTDEITLKLPKKVDLKSIFKFEETDFTAIVMPLRIKKDADGNVERTHARIKAHVEKKEVEANLGA